MAASAVSPSPRPTVKPTASAIILLEVCIAACGTVGLGDVEPVLVLVKENTGRDADGGSVGAGRTEEIGLEWSMDFD